MSILQVLLAMGGTAPPPPVYSTWNPSAKGTNIALSGGDLVASGGAGAGMVVGTQGRSSGKYQFEIVCTGGDRNFVGLAQPTANLNSFPGANTSAPAQGFGWVGYASFYMYNAAASGYGSSWTTQVIGVVLDAGVLTFYRDGVTQGTAASGISGTYYPAWGMDSSGSRTGTLNVGATPFAYPVAGATAWG